MILQKPRENGQTAQLAKNALQWDNSGMPKFMIPLNVLAVGVLLLGNAPAQQAPAPKTQPAPAAKSQSAPAAKRTTTGKPKTATTAKPAGTAHPLTTQKEKFSYALGMMQGQGVGGGLKKLSVDIDSDLASQGFKDGLAGGKMRMTPEEARAVLSAAQNEVRQKIEAANLKAGNDFLAANKTKEGVVTLPSGLEYKVITQGSGAKPTDKDTVVCNYKGTLIDGTEFDSSYKRGQPATFPVSGVIKGWTEALQLMPVGSKWQLFVPANLAYGERAPGPEIPPNSTLIFEVELISIQPPAEQKPAEEKQPAEQAQPAEPKK